MIIIPRSEVAIPAGNYLVVSGMVLRLKDGAVDGVASENCRLLVETGDEVKAITKSELALQAGSAKPEASVLRRLLWARAPRPGRVARTLTLLFDLYGPKLPPELQSKDIALVAGVWPETASREMKSLLAMGAVKYEGKQLVRVAV